MQSKSFWIEFVVTWRVKKATFFNHLNKMKNALLFEELKPWQYFFSMEILTSY